MTAIFQYSKKFKILLSVLIIAIIFGICTGIYFIMWQSTLSGINIFLLFFAFLFLAFLMLGLADLYKTKLVIERDKIHYTSYNDTKELQFDEIKGFVLNEQYIIIHPVNPKKKKIKISQYISGNMAIAEWLNNHFTNIEIKEIIEDQLAVLSDENFGDTEEERIKNLNKAKKTAKIYNILGGAVSVWLLFFPQPYKLSVAAAVVIILTGFILLSIYKGLITIDDVKQKSRPNIIAGLIFTSCVLALRALLDYNLVSYKPIILPFIITILLALLVYSRSYIQLSIKEAGTWFTYFGLMVISAMCAYGLVIHFNSTFDYTRAEFYKTEVLEKRVSSGKSKVTYFKIRDWVKTDEIIEVSVSKDLYKTTNPGDMILIYSKKGMLNIPWFIVGEYLPEYDRIVINNELEDH